MYIYVWLSRLFTVQPCAPIINASWINHVH